MKKNDISFLTSIAILVSNVLATIFLFFINNNPDCWMLDLLPLAFSLILLINTNVNTKITSSVSALLIIGSYYLRMIVLPIFYVLSNYDCLTLNENYMLYMNKASLLVIYEFSLVMFVCNLFFKKQENDFNKKEMVNISNIYAKKKMLRIILILLLLIVGITFFIYPQFKSYFRFIFSDDREVIVSYSNNFQIMRDTVPGVVYRIVILFVNILQILLPIILIKKIYTLKISTIKKFFLSLFPIILIISICTPDTATSFFIALTIIIMLINLYPKQKKILFTGAIFVGIPIVFYALFLKASTSSNWNGTSSILQAYFSGISNVATAFLMPNSPNVKIIFSDILRSIPFLSYFFQNLTVSSNIFNNVLYGVVGSHSQIIPMIGQSLYYFGFILAPIIPMLSVLIALLLEKKYRQSSDIYSKYLYLFMCIYFSLAPILYNFTIILTIFLQLYLPTKIIVDFDIKKKV